MCIHIYIYDTHIHTHNVGRELRVGEVVKFASVFLEVEVPTETFTAVLAGERFGVCVRVHVEREVVHLMERLLAYRTLVLLVG